MQQGWQRLNITVKLKRHVIITNTLYYTDTVSRNLESSPREDRTTKYVHVMVTITRIFFYKNNNKNIKNIQLSNKNIFKVSFFVLSIGKQIDHWDRKDEQTFSFKSSEASKLPLVSGNGNELDATLTCSWRLEYISKTVSRRNLSAPWNDISETESFVPTGIVTWQHKVLLQNE